MGNHTINMYLVMLFLIDNKIKSDADIIVNKIIENDILKEKKKAEC